MTQGIMWGSGVETRFSVQGRHVLLLPPVRLNWAFFRSRVPWVRFGGPIRKSQICGPAQCLGPQETYRGANSTTSMSLVP